MSGEPLTVRLWTDVVRRARLGRTVKAVALMLATYADADGSRVFPGIARVAVDCELSYNVVKAAFAALREAGLIKLVRRGARAGHADEYRLILAEDLLDRIEVLTPTQSQVAANRLRRPWGGVKSGPIDPEPQPTAWAEVPVDNAVPQPTAWAEVAAHADDTSAHGVCRGDGTSAHGVVGPQPTAWAPTIHDLDTRATSHPDEDLQTTGSGPRATGPPQDPIPSTCSNARCARGFVLSEDGTKIERCLDDAHPPPDNVVQIRPRTA